MTLFHRRRVCSFSSYQPGAFLLSHKRQTPRERDKRKSSFFLLTHVVIYSQKKASNLSQEDAKLSSTMNAVLRLVLRRCLFRRSWLLYFISWFIASFLFASILIFFFYAVFVYHCCSRSSETIVSLTTTPKRFTYELPIAVYSLLGQNSFYPKRFASIYLLRL